jgi:hypothetical protein
LKIRNRQLPNTDREIENINKKIYNGPLNLDKSSIMKKRKRDTPEFKSQIVLEILKEEKSLNEIVSDHGIHIN